jgi:hypothetical protein
MILLAHHIEVQHLPVVAVLFVAGGWIGWQFVQRVLKK